MGYKRCLNLNCRNIETTVVEKTLKFKSFAVLDFETSNLPSHNNGKTAITELCIYGLAADLLCNREGEHQTTHGPESDTEGAPPVPPTPRVLHKLTLLMNPYMLIHPIAEKITGLDNFLLEPEAKFSTNTADIVLGFLQHLQQPVCLVAHNGWSFDFPILKQTLQKLNKELPSNIVCVDSLRAFMEIDNKNREISLLSTPKQLSSSIELSPSEKTTQSDVIDLAIIEDVLDRNSQTDWRKINESTPKRSTNGNNHKRKLETDSDDETPEKEHPTKKSLSNGTFKSRRSLVFSENASPVILKKYPPRGVYKLEPMYIRIFKQPPEHSHHAEADVNMLVKLMLHYGEDFMDYAEQHAAPFSKVPSSCT